MRLELQALETVLVEAAIRYTKAHDQYGVLLDEDTAKAGEQFAACVTEFDAARDAMHEAAHALITARETVNACHICGGVVSVVTRSRLTENAPMVHWCIKHFGEHRDAMLVHKEATS